MFILLIKNIWSNTEYAYPVIYESYEEAQTNKKKIPQSNKNNLITIKELVSK